MPTCPRCALLAVALAALAFTGCDSNNPGADLDLIDGTYAVAELTFTPNGSGVAPVDIAANLDGTTRLEVFGGDAEALFVFRFVDRGLSYRSDLTAAASRGRASFQAEMEDDAQNLARLLLPTQFSLTYDEGNGSRLSGSFNLTANLQAYDPQAYQGVTAVPGRLTIRLVRQ